MAIYPTDEPNKYAHIVGGQAHVVTIQPYTCSCVAYRTRQALIERGVTSTSRMAWCTHLETITSYLAHRVPDYIMDEMKQTLLDRVRHD